MSNQLGKEKLVFRPSERLVILCALSGLAACAAHAGETIPPKVPAASPPRSEIRPITVRVSTFWPTLDNRLCPLVAKHTSPPSLGGFRPGHVDLIGALPASSPRFKATQRALGRLKKNWSGDWTELRSYCAGNRPTLDLAASPIREQVLAYVLEQLTSQAGIAAASPRVDCQKIDNVKAALKSSLSAQKKHQLEGTLDELKQLCEGQADLKFRLADIAASSQGQSSAPAPAPTTTLPSITSSSLTTFVIDGVASFLLHRAELEMQNYVIKKLRKIAECKKDASTSIPHKLFPNTCQYLEGGGTLPASFGPGLRRAFALDIADLPQDLANATGKPAGSRDQLLWRISLESAVVLVDNPDPMQIVATIERLTEKKTLANPHPFQCADKKCNQAKAELYLGATIADFALSDNPTTRASAKELLELIERNKARIIANMPDGAFKRHLNDALQEWSTLFDSVNSKVASLITDLQRARQVVLEVPPDATAADRAKAAVAATRDALLALDRATVISQCIRARAKGYISAKKQHLQTAYSFGKRCTQRGISLPAKVADFLDAIQRKDLVGMMSTGLLLAREALGDQTFNKYISADVARLLSFGAEVATAKSSKEVESAIESVAMPADGYKQKQRRRFVSITGLVGLGFGGEYLSGADSSSSGAAWTSSLVGMLGVDVNLFPGKYVSGGVYIPIVDLGGVLNVRLNHTQSVDNTAPAGLAQLFAPGVGIRLGNVGGSPVDVLLSGQLVPDERTMSGGTKQYSAFRAMVSVAADITLWSF